MNVDHIEVCRIRVQPLAYWKTQRFRHKPQPQEWPRSSNALCWYCCHAFTEVPVFLPLECDLSQNTFLFTGNFCSWNCCKQYAYEMDKKPPGVHYIGFLSYLTCRRGMQCLSPEHDVGLCDCLLEYKGIQRPRPKEHLECFGGRMPVQEYRENFMMIRSYEWIEKSFTHNPEILSTYRSIRRIRKRDEHAVWGFEYITYPPPPDYVSEYVKVLPLSGKVLRHHDQQSMVLTGNEMNIAKPARRRGPKKQQQHDHPTLQEASSSSSSSSSSSISLSDPTSVPSTKTFTGALRPKPSSRVKSGTVTGPTLLPDRRKPTEPARIIANDEQNVLVNEEQAFYTQNLRKYGNLMDSMGISISKPPSS